MISEDYIKTMFPQSRLTILGGRPFMGKTSFEHLDWPLSLIRIFLFIPIPLL